MIKLSYLAALAPTAMSVPSTSASTEKAPPPSQRSQGSNWGKDEVKALIAIWSEEDVQNALDDPLTRNTKISRKISRKLAALGYDRNQESVCNKVKVLKHKFKVTMDSNGRSSAKNS